MKALTVRVGSVDSSGTFQPAPAGTPVYLKPSRTDITFLSGAAYVAWGLNQNSEPGFRDCWRAVTNGTGYATFAQVPFTDTEMHRPKDASGNPVGPEIEWNLINPTGPNGVIVYSGKLLSTMTLPATVNVPDDLTQLATDAWRVSGAAYLALNIGGQMFSGTLTFAVGITQLPINFPSPFTSPPRVIPSNSYDKDGNSAAPGIAQDGSGADLVNNNNAMIQIASGLTSAVRIAFLVQGA